MNLPFLHFRFRPLPRSKIRKHLELHIRPWFSQPDSDTDLKQLYVNPPMHHTLATGAHVFSSKLTHSLIHHLNPLANQQLDRFKTIFTPRPKVTNRFLQLITEMPHTLLNPLSLQVQSYTSSYKEERRAMARSVS